MARREKFARLVRQASEARTKDAADLGKTMYDAFDAIGDEAKRIIIEVLLEEFAQLQASTPVDTGRAQAGWLISGEGSSWEFCPAKGQASYHPQKPELGSLMKSDLIFVINNVEYILYLEAGWSRQAPQGFLGPFLANCKRRIAAECAAMSRMS